jgi:hypothetical protein
MDDESGPGSIVPGNEPGWLQSPLVENESPAETSVQRRRRHNPIRAVGVLGAAIVIVGGAVALVVSLSGSGSPWDGVVPADFVVSATQTTLGQRTADLVFTGTVSAAGQSIPITGSGAADLSNPQQFSATIDIAMSGNKTEEREVVANNQFYMAISSDGQDISNLIPGKHWVTIPLPVSTGNSVGTGTSDPLAQMKMLATKGNIVTALGTKTIDGVTASGYSVTISRQNLLNAVQQYLPSSGLDAAAQQQIAQEAQNLPPPTIKVWFDASKLLRRMSFTISQTQSGKTVNVNLAMDFVNYGTPVSIHVPPPGDVATYNQFVSAAQALTGSGV